MSKKEYIFDTATEQNTLKELNKTFGFTSIKKSPVVWFECDICRVKIRATEKTLKMMQKRHKEIHNKLNNLEQELKEVLKNVK